MNKGRWGRGGNVRCRILSAFLWCYSFLKISKIFLRVRFIIYQKCPFKGQLSLAGYAQSSVTGELEEISHLCISDKVSLPVKFRSKPQKVPEVLNSVLNGFSFYWRISAHWCYIKELKFQISFIKSDITTKMKYFKFTQVFIFMITLNDVETSFMQVFKSIKRTNSF